MKKSKNRKKIIGAAVALIALPAAIVGISALNPTNSNKAEYVTEWSDENMASTLVKTPSFDIGTSSSQSGESLSDWTAINYDTESKGMIITTSNATFNANQSLYNLKVTNPRTFSGKKDSHVLMINSQYKEDVKEHAAKRGYRSSTFTLEANSYYKISVDAMTDLDGYTGVQRAYASIYLSGVKDENGKSVEVAFKNVTGSWQTYSFYIATGAQSQEVTLDLYLGGSDTEKSFGVAFFDEVAISKYSQNSFMATCLVNGYDFEDTIDSQEERLNKKFMVERLISRGSKLMESEQFKNSNFDFEEAVDSDTGLPTQYKATSSSHVGHAVVMDITKDGLTRFEKTGYSFVGNDLSYNIKKKSQNSQGLVMYTDVGKSAYVTCEPKQDIEIKAHAVYKITASLKISKLDGNFYVNVYETKDWIANYPLKEEDIEFRTDSTSGISSNQTNNATNDYQTITFYVKGRSTYDSAIRLQFALGTSDSPASGCVVVDNISISYAKSGDATSADNFLDLDSSGEESSDDSSSSSFTNNKFNETTIESADFAYPLTATGWTLTQESGKADNVVGGVVYLYNDEQYAKEYQQKDSTGSYVYNWANTAYPGNPRKDLKDDVNNAYMFHNGVASYQSIESNKITLSSNSCYGITFDYNVFNADPSKIGPNATSKPGLTVEIKDSNGILLYKDKFVSLSNGVWSGEDNRQTIYIQTSLVSSHDITVKIMYGEEDDKETGTAYIDNISLISSVEPSVFENATRKVDLTDYMLNLDPTGSMNGEQEIYQPAGYSFTPNTEGASVGGIIPGKDNAFNVTNENESNMLTIVSKQFNGNGTIKSLFPLSLSATSYYKLSFSLRTDVRIDPSATFTQEEKDDNHECSYGATVGLTGFEKTSPIISNDDFGSYSIYIYSDTSQTTYLEFSLALDNHTRGSIYVTDINFENSTQEAYTSASAADNESFGKTVFTSKLIDSQEPEEPSEDEESPAAFDPTNWIVIPSLLMALAVIIAIVGWAMRKVKIKKIETVKQETYNRKVSLNQDLISSQAKTIRDQEVAAIEKNIKDMKDQVAMLEEDHKQVIKEARLNKRGKVTKETEREFKSYSTKITRLQEKIEILEEQLGKMYSPDYLLSVEKRLASEEEKRLKELGKTKVEENKSEEDK